MTDDGQYKKIKVNPPSQTDVGITEFMSDSSLGFNAIIKHRYSDFLVNEIDLNAQIVQLKSLTVPPHYIDLIHPQQVQEKIMDDDQGKDELFQIIKSESAIQQLKEFIQSKTLEGSIISEEILDKSIRSQVHHIVKKYFSDFMDTETHGSCIHFKLKNGKKSNRFNASPRWSLLGGEYLHFTLYKENKDTMEAMDLLCKRLHCSSKLFTYAGTKDKRGITCQRVSVHRMSALKLCNLDLSADGIRTGDYEYKPKRLELGDLNGNRFCLTLRDVTPQDTELIQKTLVSFKENGFINYFGMQRFGTHSIPTHVIGIALLNGNWKEAVDLLLQEKPEDSVKVKNARQVWSESKDAKKALDLFPRRCIAERSILSSFIKSKKDDYDYLNSILSIPRNLRTLYVHAYQSFVWNQMASERMKLYGNQLVMGDLVSQLDPSDSQSKVKVISSTVELSQYTIEDVVLPQPGHTILYPENEMKIKYKECMEKDGFDYTQMQRKQKDFSLPGSYRKLISKPKDVDWTLIRYTDDTIPLSLTDLDKLNGKAIPESLQDGEFLAVVMELSLPSSTYATMALREFLKSETSSSFQSNLSIQGHVNGNVVQKSLENLCENGLEE